MNYKKFSLIIVIGYGKIVADILKFIHEKQKMFGYDIFYIEHEVCSFNRAKKISDELNIPNKTITDKQELKSFLMLPKETLIISVNNNYIFPAEVVDMPNITIINFHNALLPEYPGRNAPSWAIFRNEKETGITWHYITANIDEGDIICQKKYTIGSDDKAYELAKVLMDLAFDCFKEYFIKILEENVSVIRQQIELNHKIYRAKEVPGNAHFTMEDSPAYIYRLLRAVDYGTYRIFPPVTADYNGKKIKIIRYEKTSINNIQPKSGILYIPLDKSNILKLKYVEITTGSEWGGVDSIEHFYCMLTELRKTKRKLITNFYMNVQKFEEAIIRDEVKYEYKYGKYLNIIIADEGFSRLYYYIAEVNDYHFSGADEFVVCDIFFKVGDKEIDKMLERICQEGFRKYKSYHKLSVKKPKIDVLIENPEIKIIQTVDKSAIKMMYQYFDKYSDCLPRHIELEKFMREKKFLSVYDTNNQELLGEMIYTEKNHSIIEEFIFIKENARRRKLGVMLSSFWYKMFDGLDVKFITWVRDDNIPSIELHKKYNYQECGIKKITYVKG